MLTELKKILREYEDGLSACDVSFDDADFGKLANLRGTTWQKFKNLIESNEKA